MIHFVPPSLAFIIPCFVYVNILQNNALISFLHKKALGPSCLSPPFNHYHPNSQLIPFFLSVVPISPQYSVLHSFHQIKLPKLKLCHIFFPCLQTFSFSLLLDELILASKALQINQHFHSLLPLYPVPQASITFSRRKHALASHVHTFARAAYNRGWPIMPCGIWSTSCFCIAP